MEGLTRLVTEALARNGFQTPETIKPLQEEPRSGEGQRAAPVGDDRARKAEPPPLPWGF